MRCSLGRGRFEATEERSPGLEWTNRIPAPGFGAPGDDPDAFDARNARSTFHP